MTEKKRNYLPCHCCYRSEPIYTPPRNVLQPARGQHIPGFECAGLALTERELALLADVANRTIAEIFKV